MKIKKILFPTDFSEASRNALKHAIAVAKMFDAELEIVHVVFDENYLITMYIPQGTLDGLYSELEDSVQTHLKKFLSGFKELNDIKYTTKLLKGTPYLKIIKHAKETNADLIVIGTHGRTGFNHLLFGSTTEKIIGRAPCPVQTVNACYLEGICDI